MFVHIKPDYSSVHPQTTTLRQVLKDEHKVLAALIDHASGIFTDYRESLTDKRNGPKQVGPKLTELHNWLAEALLLAGQYLRDEGTFRDAGLTYSDSGGRAMQRQSGRLLNLCARIVAQLLDDSRTGAVASAQGVTEMAMAIVQVVLSSLRSSTPNTPPEREHPDRGRWFQLSARARNRLSELWLESARNDQELANQLTPRKAR